MKFPPMYRSMIALDTVQHRELRVNQAAATLDNAKDLNAVFLNVVEFADSCQTFPIVFVRAGQGQDGKPAPLMPLAVLGLQVTIEQITALGAAPFLALLVVMATTFFAGIAGARFATQSKYAGMLAGGSTAICGASAALALYGVIGKERLSQAQFALTLVGISLASAFAMSVYPALAAELHLTDQQAGFLIGASIHDVAQAIGGGYAFSDVAGGYATIVKLSRVALLAPVVVHLYLQLAWR